MSGASAGKLLSIEHFRPQLSRVKHIILRPVAGALGTAFKVHTDSPTVCLTFDDGPVHPTTSEILEALREFGARATFFVLMSRGRIDPGLVREVQSAGHEIALHGPDHLPLRSFKRSEVYERTRRAKAELETIIDADVRWFRPPYGKQSYATWAAVRDAGLEPVYWSAETWDWIDVEPVARLEKTLEGATPGAIILAHDNFADVIDGVDDGPIPVLDRAALVREVLSGLAGKGINSVTLTELASSGNVERRVIFPR